MNDKLINALEDCLQSLQNGASLDSALERYPDLSAELRPLLLAAQTAQRIDLDPLPQKAFLAGRTRFLAQVNDLRRKQAPRRGLNPVMRFALVAALVLVFLVVSGNGLVKASASSLPNDPLYGVKRTAEVVQLGLTFNPTQKVALEDEFYQRRIDETEALLTDRRAVAVIFSGLVESRIPEGWRISGIQVSVTPQTQVVGTIASGAHVQVEGVTTAEDTVLAQKISIDQSGIYGNGSSNPAGAGEGQSIETSQPGSGETPLQEGGGN